MKTLEQFLALNPGYGETEYLCYLQGFHEAMIAGNANANLEYLARRVVGALDKAGRKHRWPEPPDAFDRIDENVRKI